MNTYQPNAVAMDANDDCIVDLNCLSAWLWQEVDLCSIFSHDQNSVKLLQKVAENKDLPSILLEQLSYHPASEIRLAVAENPATPNSVLETLVSDIDPDVRYALAENHSLSDELLTRLKQDEHPYVADRAAKTLTRLSETTVTQVLHVAFGTRMRPVEMLALLA
ncbi:MAG TPA: hypothetical protein V6C76_05985 [Drouetiella sp.]